MQLTKGRAVALIAAGVLAFTAVGTGGAVAARLITGAQIEDGTITQADINDATEAALKGQKGDPGTDGVSGLVTVNGDDRIVQSDGFGSSDAICPAGKKAVSGGWKFASASGNGADLQDFLVVGDEPIDNNNAWRISVLNVDFDNDGTGTLTFQSYAVCANVN